MGIVPTEMELILEQTQQGISHEVSEILLKLNPPDHRILTDGGEANSLQEMDDPNITMEEYIQLMDDKAQRCSKTFNWETATYGNVYCDDSNLFTDFEKDFPATVYDDGSTLNQNASSKPTVSI
nr:hypothetical protein [Tanacetum cinerariifolium]